MRSRCRTRTLLWLGIGLWHVGALGAQGVTSAAVQGTILSADSVPVPEATVLATAMGAFELPLIPPTSSQLVLIRGRAFHRLQRPRVAGRAALVAALGQSDSPVTLDSALCYPWFAAVTPTADS